MDRYNKKVKTFCFLNGKERTLTEMLTQCRYVVYAQAEVWFWGFSQTPWGHRAIDSATLMERQVCQA